MPSYPLSLPSSPGPVSIRLTLMQVVARTESPFTGQEQVVAHAGRWWTAEIELPPMLRAQAAAWEAFIASLRGGYGTFLLPAAKKRTLVGAATGTPLVNGTATAGAVTLATDGWTPSITGILRAGDFVQIGSGSTAELKQLVADASSNGSGESTLEFSTPVRTAPADNSPIVVVNPAGVFRLSGPPPGCTVDPAGHHVFDIISAREAIP